MKRTLLCLNLLFLFLISPCASAQISKNEKKALIALYDATSGDEWTHSWNLNMSPQSWYGVVIENDHVVELNLHKNNLQGTLPESINDLRKLEVLNLAFNKITGEIPFDLVKLEQLTVLRLEMNRLKAVSYTHLTLPTTPYV